MSVTLKVALVAGPMYDGLYERLPEFEARSGLRVEIGFRGDHPALNAHLASQGAQYDLVSTHSKYAPSQAQLLRPLDDLLEPGELAPFAPSALELMRYQGLLLQLPRVVDSKILLYRSDLFGEPRLRERYAGQAGRELAPPQSWDELAFQAAFFKQHGGLDGFVFPGKESGLFGHFFEILCSAGGQLFTPDLEPAFVSAAGRYAVELLRKLYRSAAPPEVPNWHYDQVAAHFLAGKAALTTDWPGAWHAYVRSPLVGARFEPALYPLGPAGLRRVYSGGHSFALTRGARDLSAALELLRFLTAEESQVHEARLGSVVPRGRAMALVRGEAEPGSREARRLEILEETMRDCMAIPPKFPAYPACEDALWESIRAALTGQLEVAQALEQAAQAVRLATGSVQTPARGGARATPRARPGRRSATPVRAADQDRARSSRTRKRSQASSPRAKKSGSGGRKRSRPDRKGKVSRGGGKVGRGEAKVGRGGGKAGRGVGKVGRAGGRVRAGKGRSRGRSGRAKRRS